MNDNTLSRMKIILDLEQR